MLKSLQNINLISKFIILLTKILNIMKTLVILFAIIFLVSCESDRYCFTCTTEIYDLDQNGIKVKEYDRTYCETLEWIMIYEHEMTCITQKYYSPELGINKEIRAELITKCKIK